MTAVPPTVLFIAPVEPWCRENGSSVIIADLLEGLYASGDLTVFPVFLRRPPAGCIPSPPLGPRGIQLGIEGIPRWMSIVKAVALRSSPIRLRFDIGYVTRELLRVVARAGVTPALVHVEHLPLVDMGAALARHFGCPLVYRSHNIEAQLLRRRLGIGGPVTAALLRYMARAEASASELCDLTLCISESDADWIRVHAPRARVATLPCSLLLDRYQPVPGQQRSAQPQIAFAGGLDWPPNEAGLSWFVDNVLPLIVTRVPEARLAVLARGAAQRRWVMSNPNIHVVDDTSDARGLFARSWVSIAPLLQGGGVRIKIPESLALGCPVVSTTIGAEGHHLPGLTRADDPQAFADACVQHLGLVPSDAAARQFRTAVSVRYGANALAARLQSLWNDLIAARAA